MEPQGCVVGLMSDAIRNAAQHLPVSVGASRPKHRARGLDHRISDDANGASELLLSQASVRAEQKDIREWLLRQDHVANSFLRHGVIKIKP